MNIYVWIYSFLLYTSLRTFDVHSTQLVLSELDYKLHEMNAILTYLIKRVGFNKAMILTWLFFASIIAFLDAQVVYPFIGFPTLWLIFGIFHVLAAASNYQLHFQIGILGAETIEETTQRLIGMLKKLSPWKKVIFLLRWNFFNVFLALYCIFAYVLTWLLLMSLNISLGGQIPYLLLLTPLAMIFDLIWFFPTIVFGYLIITRRRLKITNYKETYSEKNRRYMAVPVSLLEQALKEAKETGADYVQFLIPFDK